MVVPVSVPVPPAPAHLCTSACPPPVRSTIRNAKSIHSRSRQQLSQEAYRRNSRRYLQQKASPRRNSRRSAKSPLRERKNQGTEHARHAFSGSVWGARCDFCLLWFYREHPRGVWFWLWERAEEGGSGRPPTAERRAHPGALHRQHPQEGQHPRAPLRLHQLVRYNISCSCSAEAHVSRARFSVVFVEQWPVRDDCSCKADIW